MSISLHSLFIKTVAIVQEIDWKCVDCGEDCDTKCRSNTTDALKGYDAVK